MWPTFTTAYDVGVRPLLANEITPEQAFDRAADPFRVFGSPVTMISSDAPIADASAAADPPPGVGSEELKAESRSRTERSTSIGLTQAGLS